MKTVALLIIGQAVALGIALAFLVVPGTAVFLHVFGAGQLPFVYLSVAVVGALVSFGLTRLQARYGLFRSAVSTMAMSALTALICWALLVGWSANWTAYGILILFNLQIQLGFVFIGAQAGRVFDIQEIKRIFPRIVAGFVFGFMIGGFVAAQFVSLFGHAHDLLAAAAAMTMVMIGLMLGASRHVEDAFHLPSQPASEEALPNRSLRQILAIPLVGAVFVYQVLSAMGTQMLEYLVYDRAAARFSGTEELAAFMGEYTGILNLTDLLVLVLLGGFLMSRFGLRFGLGANPVIVTGLIAVAMIVAVVSGPDAMLFFVLVAIARISDITMADAATRTSVNTTFRALPVQQRLAAQVGVEGAGVPIALGLTALLILAINAVPGSSVVHVVIATLVVCALWSAVAWVVYRRYQAAVVKEARRRSLDGEVVDLDEPATREALYALGLSDDPRDVSTAVRFIEGMEPEQADDLLRTAAASPSIDVRIAVLDRLVSHDPDGALAIAADCLATGSPDHILTGIRTLGRIEGGACRPLLDPFLDDDDPTVRAAAIGAVFRRGEETEALVAGLSEAAGSSDRDERRCAAIAIAEAGRAPAIALVATLLGDPDRHVRAAAAAAVAFLNDEQRIALLSGLVDVPQRAGFLRASRRSASPEFSARVATDLANDVVPTIELVRVLNAAGWSATAQHKGLFDRLLREKVDHIDRARVWVERTFPSADSLSPAETRLRRALGAEAAGAGRALIEVLALGYDKTLVVRVGGILQGKLEGEPAMARESLDLVLLPEHRQPVTGALATAFDQNLSISGRRKPPAEADMIVTLVELAADCRWAIHGDWLQACALDLLRERDADPATTSTITPVGPVSAELVGLGS